MLFNMLFLSVIQYGVLITTSALLFISKKNVNMSFFNPESKRSLLQSNVKCLFVCLSVTVQNTLFRRSWRPLVGGRRGCSKIVSAKNGGGPCICISQEIQCLPNADWCAWVWKFPRKACVEGVEPNINLLRKFIQFKFRHFEKGRLGLLKYQMCACLK